MPGDHGTHEATINGQIDAIDKAGSIAVAILPLMNTIDDYYKASKKDSPLANTAGFSLQNQLLLNHLVFASRPSASSAA